MGFTAANDWDLFDPPMTENDWFAVGRSVPEVLSTREFQENYGLCVKISKKQILCVSTRGFVVSVFAKSGHYHRRWQ